jgi:hypothetical protein
MSRTLHRHEQQHMHSYHNTHTLLQQLMVQPTDLQWVSAHLKQYKQVAGAPSSLLGHACTQSTDSAVMCSPESASLAGHPSKFAAITTTGSHDGFRQINNQGWVCRCIHIIPYQPALACSATLASMASTSGNHRSIRLHLSQQGSARHRSQPETGFASAAASGDSMYCAAPWLLEQLA